MQSLGKIRSIIGGILFGLLFLGLGAWTLIDPKNATDLTSSDSGRYKARLVKAVLGWLFDTVGVVPAGILFALVGVVIIGLTIRTAFSAKQPESPAATR